MNEAENIKQLPKDWKWIKLGEVCNVVTGTTPPKSDSLNYGNDIPFFKPPHLWDGMISDTEEMLSLKGAEKGRVVPPNTVLVTCIGNLGRTGFVKKTAAFNQQINAILENQNIDGKFIFYQAQSPLFKRQLEKLATGTTVSIVNKSNFETIDIPLPPKPTQQAIVSKIEELFSELDKGIENLRTAQQQLKTYRQSVLKWAFEGKLTNENVKEGELPKGWKWFTLSEVSKVSGGLTKNAKRQNLELQLPFLRVGNVYFNFLDLTEMHTIGINKNEIQRVRLEKDDLLFVEGNGSIEQIGRVALWNGSIENCVHQNHLIKARLSTKVVPKYALYFYCSKNGRDKIKEQANSTSGLHTLSLGKISKLELPLCSIGEQNSIVEEIESRLSVADKMEESITQSLQQAEALRQSILKKAFEGKLIATETIETINQTAKVIPIERKVLAGKIIHLLNDDRYFGLTKFQKILYLVENYTEVSYDTNFIQERAGPYDKAFTTAFRKEMQEQGWFMEEQQGNITKFITGSKVGSLIKDFAKYFRSDGAKISFVLKQLKDKTTHDAELIATLYAVWNNRLITRKPIKIELLVEDFFNWSAKKKEEFHEGEIKEMFVWMNEISLMPSGFGKVIGAAN